jgi:transcriptional regulator of acetoin/glycerol metabolism
VVDQTQGSTTADSDSSTGADKALRPGLILALSCTDPWEGGERFVLDGVMRATVGRGSPRRAERTDVTFAIRISDAKMSSAHALLKCEDRGWVLTDAGSRNGTMVNGRRVETTSLRDGDRIQLGHSFFVYRELMPAKPPWDPSWPAALHTLEPALAAAFRRLARIAGTPLPVMLLGETGTGKELTARAIHELSRRSGPFVAVNCGAIPANLVESELFGHEKGAFSGAHQDRTGLVRAAHRGTLLLDEIGELPFPAQAALLRVLQEREVVPVGATTPIRVDLRVICATHQPIGERIERGEFRADLYARLAGFVFELPPLRERIEDLGMIVAQLLSRQQVTPSSVRLRPEVGEAMLRYSWPHNVRELEQALLAAVALCEDQVVRLAHLPEALQAGAGEREAPAADLSDEERELRARVIEKLREEGGNVTGAARQLGKARQQVQRWMKRLHIAPEDYE